MPAIKVASTDGSRVAVVPVTPKTTVSALLRSALIRLDAEDEAVDEFMLTLAGDTRASLAADDMVLDVLDHHQEVVVTPRPNKRRKITHTLPPGSAAANEPGSAVAIPDSAVVLSAAANVAPTFAPAAAAVLPAAGTCDGPLEVQWAMQSGEHGTMRVDPEVMQLCKLAACISAQVAAPLDPAEVSELAACGEDGTCAVELYAEEGYALGSSGASRHATLAQLGWSLSGSARCYVVCCAAPHETLEPPGSADATAGKEQIFIRGDRTFVVMADLDDSLLTLQLKIKAKMTWPVHRQLLSYQSHRLRDPTKTLRELGISGHSTLMIKLSLPPASKSLTGWESNFAATMYEPRAAQSPAGLAAFFASLYVLSSSVQGVEQKRLLGGLRRLTNFPPLVASVHELFEHRQLSMAQRIAVVEGLYTLFRAIAPCALPAAPAADAGCADQCVFEIAPRCWAWLLRNCTDADATTEQWTMISLACPLSHARLGALTDIVRPPAWWRPDRVRGRACSRSAILVAIHEEAQHAVEVGADGGDKPRALNLDDLVSAPDIARLVAGHDAQGFAPSICVWQAPTTSLLHPVRPAALGAPTRELWGATTDAALKGALDGKLMPSGPLELKGSHRSTSLCRNPTNGTHLCVFVGRTKATVPMAQLYDPLNGGTSTHDFDDWAAALNDSALADTANDGVPRITRPPAEAIVVLLDVSASMSWDGFAVPAVTFDPIERERTRGDVRVGDTVRFRADAIVADADGTVLPFPPGLTGEVFELESPQAVSCRATRGSSRQVSPTIATVEFRWGASVESVSYLHMRQQDETDGIRVVANDLEVLTSHGVAALMPMDRMSTVKQLFTSFANRSMAYDLPHTIGLTTFGADVQRVRELTEAFESFKRAIDGTEADGCTRLFDALNMARDELHSFTTNLTMAPPEGVVKRILVLTDGADTASRTEARDVCAALQREGVVVDSVVIGSEIEKHTLRAISVATGGCAFHPKSIDEALRLFETETILSLRLRAPTDSHRPRAPIASDIDLMGLAGGRLGAHEGWDEPPEARVPEGMREAVSLPARALNHALVDARGRASSNGRLKRILRELSAYVRAPHPAFDVFPSEVQLDLWQLLLKGPDGTPYTNGVFHLWMRFPRDYPAEAPEVRFLTPIHHCNINSSGKVCHSVFDRNWTTDTSVSAVLSCVYGLLLEPEPDDPLDSVLAMQFISSRSAYDAAAAEKTRAKASASYDILRARLLHEDLDVAGAADLAAGTHPRHLCCPITAELFSEPVTTKHGQTFEKAALLNAVRRKPECPLTRQALREDEVMALASNVFIKDAVNQYKLATPWWDE